MTTGRIVLITMPYDQVDIVGDFLDWHLDLGIDLILALDGGSTDGTREVLEKYASTGRVVWFPLPERDMTKYSIADELAAMARDRYQADWIIYADVDEFVCTHGKSLRTGPGRVRPRRCHAPGYSAPDHDRSADPAGPSRDRDPDAADRPGGRADC